MSDAERGALGPRLLWPLLAVVVGGAILVLAVPRLVAASWLALREPVVAAIQLQAPVSEGELRGLIASRELALEWVDTGAAHAEVAAALTLLAASAEPEGALERELLERAAEAMRAGLARAPADPRGWLRLAYTTTVLDGPNPRAARALQLSIRTGPYETPEFLTVRTDLALMHWPLFDAAERAQIEEQIRLLWREAPGALIRLVVDERSHLAVVGSALAARPGGRERLDALVPERTRDLPVAPAP